MLLPLGAMEVHGCISEEECLETIAKLDQLNSDGLLEETRADVNAAIQKLVQACAPPSTSPVSAANCALVAQMGGLAPLSALLCNESTFSSVRVDVYGIFEAMLSVDEPATMATVFSQLALLDVHLAVQSDIQRPFSAAAKNLPAGNRRNPLRAAGSLARSG